MTISNIVVFVIFVLLIHEIRARRILEVQYHEVRLLRHLGEVEYMRRLPRREPIVDVNAIWWQELSWFEKKYRWMKFYFLWNFNWLFGIVSFDAISGRLDFKP
jgi:hypothetical protein